MKALVVAASRYGSTFQYAGAIADGLKCPLFRLKDEAKPRLEEVRVVVVGSPIYGPGVLPEMKIWLAEAAADFQGKEVAAFVVCGDTLWLPRAQEGGTGNLAKLVSLLPRPPLATAIFGGRLRMDVLDDGDRLGILSFYRRLGRPATGFDRMNLSDATAFAGVIKDFLNRCPEDAQISPDHRV
jgi:menaquinone-dependent protoporphyrinogen IX oxidase